jgi:flagellar biosynthesis/type III secretory pathway M-ring protein FliF/YscJ
MANVTVVSKIRFLTCLAAVILLIVSPILAFAFLEFGNIPADIKDEQVSAIKYADGLDAALYKMEWGRFQPDGVQIIVDQQRRFADYLDSAAHHLYTDEQRAKLGTLAQEAKPTLDAFRHADPHDDAMNAKMRDLHVMVSDLENANDAALEQYSEAAKSRARQLLVVVAVAGVVFPLICFALIWRLTQSMRAELRTIRTEVENVADTPSAKDPAVARMIEATDQALTRMGFPKPNPMLADE